MTERPEITFPCKYPIKVIGKAEDIFKETIADIVKRHCPEFNVSGIDVNDSRNGNYVSLRFFIIAKGRDHIQQLFADLQMNKNVRMVL